MTVREDLDRLANEAQEAALRASFDRLSTPAAIALAEDCVDTATGLIESGKLISEGGLGIPQRHRGDVTLSREALDFGVELRRLGQSLATYAKSRRGSVRVKPTPPVKSQEQLHAERVRRGERAAMRQQGLPVPYDADELQERARAAAQERQRAQHEAEGQARLVAEFGEEQLASFGSFPLLSAAEQREYDQSTGALDAARRGVTTEEPR